MTSPGVLYLLSIIHYPLFTIKRMTLFDQVSEDIKTAMKARDKVALEALRNVKKLFLEERQPREPTIP